MGDRALFEATGDKVWACGIPLTRIQELTVPAPGRNCTGVAVEKTREVIKKQQAPAQGAVVS